MSNAYLRKSGGSLIMTIPVSYAEQNHLDAGSCVSIKINGTELKVQPARQRLKLSELFLATPPTEARVAGWDAIPKIGTEV